MAGSRKHTALLLLRKSSGSFPSLLYLPFEGGDLPARAKAELFLSGKQKGPNLSSSSSPPFISLFLLFSRVPTLVSLFLPSEEKERKEPGRKRCVRGGKRKGGEEGIPAYSGQKVIPPLYQ